MQQALHPVFFCVLARPLYGPCLPSLPSTLTFPSDRAYLPFPPRPARVPCPGASQRESTAQSISVLPQPVVKLWADSPKWTGRPRNFPPDKWKTLSHLTTDRGLAQAVAACVPPASGHKKERPCRNEVPTQPPAPTACAKPVTCTFQSAPSPRRPSAHGLQARGSPPNGRYPAGR